MKKISEYDICLHCGYSRRNHHEFMDIHPYDCMCTNGHWGNKQPTVVCSKFVPALTHSNCKECEHSKLCHWS